VGDRKPASVPRTRSVRRVSLGSDAGLPSRSAAVWQLSGGSGYSDAFITDLSLQSAGARDTTSAITAGIMPPPSRGTTRRVLVTSGDPRPGGNQFGLEAAEIRRSLLPARVDVREVACIDLAEIPQHLDELCPAVLHLAAHRARDGVAVIFEGGTLMASFEGLAEAVCRARLPPPLVVIGVCDSLPLAILLSDTIESVIAWPDTVDDEQTRAFAGLLYRALASGRTVHEATGDATAAVTQRWPALVAPVVLGAIEARPIRSS